jgi:hypothetical protein
MAIRKAITKQIQPAIKRGFLAKSDREEKDVTWSIRE